MARRRYADTDETFLLAGVGAARKTGRARRVCAADKLPWAFMRINTCVEYYPDAGAPALRSSVDVAAWIRGVIPTESAMQELLLVVSLDTKNVPLGLSEVHRGGRSSSIVDRPLVFQAPVLLAASGIILAHNHPSGSAEPSQEDVALTREMVKAGDIMGIPLLDHVVLGHEGRYASFLDMGLLRS